MEGTSREAATLQKPMVFCAPPAGLPFKAFQNQAGVEFRRWAFRYSSFPILGGLLDLITNLPMLIIAIICKLIMAAIVGVYAIVAKVINSVYRFIQGDWCAEYMSPLPINVMTMAAQLDHLFTGNPVQKHLDEKEERNDYLNAVKIMAQQYAIPYNEGDRPFPRYA